MSDNTRFVNRHLSVPELISSFSEVERSALDAWGERAYALTLEGLDASTEKEMQFKHALAEGNSPTTRFQLIWYRFLNALSIQNRLFECESEINQLTIKNSSLASEVNATANEIHRLTVWGKSGWKRVKEQDAALENLKRIKDKEDIEQKSPMDLIDAPGKNAIRSNLPSHVSNYSNPAEFNGFVPLPPDEYEYSDRWGHSGGNDWREQK